MPFPNSHSFLITELGSFFFLPFAYYSFYCIITICQFSTIVKKNNKNEIIVILNLRQTCLYNCHVISEEFKSIIYVLGWWCFLYVRGRWAGFWLFLKVVKLYTLKYFVISTQCSGCIQCFEYQRFRIFFKPFTGFS